MMSTILNNFKNIYLFDKDDTHQSWLSLSDSDIKTCLEFGNSINSIPMYLSARNANKTRVKNQIIEGKLGEFACARFLQQNPIFEFPKNVIPDTRIYEKGKKSWDADLMYNKVNARFPNVHCKTCTVRNASKYNESYVFQCSNGLFRNVTSNDYICMILYDTDNKLFCIRCLVKWSYLYGLNIFKSPKLEKHRGSKICIYYEDLI